MNTKIPLAILIAITTSCTTQAQEPAEKPTNRHFPRFPQDTIASKEYHIHAGNTSMTVDANRGGRIMSFAYNGVEMLSQIKLPNMFGSTFWTSPQAEWSWPPVREHDILPYTVTSEADSIVMVSQLSEKIPLRIKKVFTSTDSAIIVTYTIINESDDTRKVAPWEITRVPNAGSVFFEADVQRITPSGIMPFVQKGSIAWYDIDQNDEGNRKINSDGKGWLGYINNNILLLKKFQDLTPSQPAPDEAEIQVYVNRGKNYVEIEEQGAYTTLQPHQSLSWAVEWSLNPITPTTLQQYGIK